MSSSISADEDWSIISSSSDFEDDPTTTSSIGDSAPESEVANPADLDADEIDESTCTIRQDNGSGFEKADEDFGAQSGDSSTPQTDLNEAISPCAPLHNRCVITGAASRVAAMICREDRRIRSVSRRTFAATLAKPLLALRAQVATQATEKIALYQHAAYSLLAVLEAHQDFLLYYLLAMLSTGLSAIYFWPSPIPEVTYSLRLQQLWTDTVYEPQQQGYTRYFHAAKPKKLKAAKYIDVASRQAWALWVSTKASVSPSVESLKCNYKPFVTNVQATLQSSSLQIWRRIDSWKSGPYVNSAKEHAASALRSALALLNADALECLAKKSRANIERWFSPVVAASGQAYQRVLDKDVGAHISKGLHNCKTVSQKWLNITAQLWEDLRRTQLVPLTSRIQEHLNVFASKTAAHSQVAATEASRFLGEWKKMTFVHLNNVWRAVKNWYTDVLSDC